MALATVAWGSWTQASQRPHSCALTASVIGSAWITKSRASANFASNASLQWTRANLSRLRDKVACSRYRRVSCCGLVFHDNVGLLCDHHLLVPEASHSSIHVLEALRKCGIVYLHSSKGCEGGVDRLIHMSGQIVGQGSAGHCNIVRELFPVLVTVSFVTGNS